MLERIVVAAIQMTADLDKKANLETAERLVGEAARSGAQLVVLPELFNCLGPYPAVTEQAESIPGPTSERLAGWASQNGVVLCGGSFAEKSPLPQKSYNTSLVFDERGALLARYRKIHLFDIDLPGQVTVRESDSLSPGEEVSLADTRLARLGVAICYDLRFPELFRRLSERGAEVICLPAAFSRTTGAAHWEVLLKARAIENQSFVVAANQVGEHTVQFATYGHSCIIDPWGITLAETDATGEAVVMAELRGEQLQTVRSRLPALTHRRLR